MTYIDWMGAAALNPSTQFIALYEIYNTQSNQVQIGFLNK